jgi:hypothetical protein
LIRPLLSFRSKDNLFLILILNQNFQ